MILFETKPIQEKEEIYPSAGLRTWKWVLEAKIWKDSRGCSLELNSKYKRENSLEWGLGAHYFSLNLTKHFHFGSQHDYYDGPHCSFSLGFLHICWSWNWCNKCMPEE